MRSLKDVIDKKPSRDFAAQNRQAYLNQLKNYLSSPEATCFFECYDTIMGTRELPIVATEVQCDGPKSEWAKTEMTQLADSLHHFISAKDTSLSLPTRSFINRQKKYGMAHDGRYGTRSDNKKEAVRILHAIVTRYTNTYLLQALLETAKTMKENEHDMADAVLLALGAAIEIYNMTPTDLSFSNGTIRVIGIDPGIRNLGICLLELTGMSEASEPLFKIHLLHLVDLKKNENCIKLSLASGAGLPRALLLCPKPQWALSDADQMPLALTTTKKRKRPKSAKQQSPRPKVKRIKTEIVK